ncbi:MAG: hypothetical protein ACKV2Q_09850 [Planctomycetaceae bacterium]
MATDAPSNLSGTRHRRIAAADGVVPRKFARASDCRRCRRFRQWQAEAALRRHLSGDYLDLVRFYLNHHRFPRPDRPDRPDRVGRSPHELLTGQTQLHWLDQLTNAPRRAA